MDMKLIVIPAALIVIALIVMIMLNAKGKKSAGKAENVMKDYVKTEIPSLQNQYFDVINLLEDAINAEFIWVVAYNKDGMYVIPSKPNPFTQKIKRYEDETPAFNWRKQLAANILTGNKTEEIDYLPFSAIRAVTVHRDKKKIKIEIGDVRKEFKYQSKDCFGAEQSELIARFLNYLKTKNNQ